MFNPANNIVTQIEELVELHDLSFIDAIIYYAEKNELEIEFLAEVLKKNDIIRFQIQLEAESLHFLKKQNRLPI